MSDLDALLLLLAVLLSAGLGAGLGAYAVGRRFAPVARLAGAPRGAVGPVDAGAVPIGAGGPCDHVFTGHPVEQDRGGYRIHRCVKCGDELAVAGRG